MIKKNRSEKNWLVVTLNFIDYWMTKIESTVLAIGVILMAVNTITNVVSRFIFNHSIIFAEELNSIFILLVTFAGLSYVAKHGRHIRMSAIYDMMPERSRKKLMIIITLVTALFMFLLAYYSLHYIRILIAKGRIMPALGIPVYFPLLWVPVGFFMTGIQYTLTFIKNITQKEIYISTSIKENDYYEVKK